MEKVHFKELKVLLLGINKISDINVLERVKFKKLKKLDLSNNLISDITVLTRVEFKELKELDLTSNKISDINISQIFTEKLYLKKVIKSNLDHFENVLYKCFNKLNID